MRRTGRWSRRSWSACAERPTLLVLDNFEQLVDAAPVVRDLLERAPDAPRSSRASCRCASPASASIASSRCRRDAAVALFAERARAVLPAFDAEAEREAVAAVCARVDDLPLAIELAAARMAIMAPRDLLARLDHSLGVLARGPRDAPQRHRSLEATLEWAHGLLRPEERTLLARLSVFAGPVAARRRGGGRRRRRRARPGRRRRRARRPARRVARRGGGRAASTAFGTSCQRPSASSRRGG